MKRALALAVGLTVGSASATADTWSWPNEISFAEAYNTSYCSEFDTTGPSGLQSLVDAKSLTMVSVFDTSVVESVRVLTWDSSVIGKLQLEVLAPEGTVILDVYDPGPWTGPTRGWLGDSPVVNLNDLLIAAGIDTATPFRFKVGKHSLDANNTLLLEGMEPGEMLFGYNDGGLTKGDQDANEPVFVGYAPLASRLAECPDGANIIIGTEDDDEIIGTNGVDCIFGLGGDDLIKGRQGDDIIFGGAGNDDIRANRGNDIVYGGSCNDTIRGGRDNDQLFGGTGDDDIRGHWGNDSLSGEEGNDTLRGGKGVDWLTGGDGDDVLRGGQGNDNLYGQAGVDALYGGKDHDILSGGAGDDMLYGRLGADQLYGGPGNDFLQGNRGNDFVVGGAGDDDVRGGKDDDVIDGADGYDSARGGQGTDACFAVEESVSCESNALPASTPFEADYYGYGEQGMTSNGNPVAAARSNPDSALSFVEENVEGGFYSLGFGGSAAVFFLSEAVNGPGADIRVYEKTYCCNAGYPVETADVFAWNDGAGEWVFLGEASSVPGDDSNHVNEFDLGDLPFTWGILVVDTTDALSFANINGDGFDLNGIEALHGVP